MDDNITFPLQYSAQEIVRASGAEIRSIPSDSNLNM